MHWIYSPVFSIFLYNSYKEYIIKAITDVLFLFFHHVLVDVECVFKAACVCPCVQTEWDAFLESVDRGLQTTDGQLSGGKTADSLSPDTPFTDGRSGE